MIYSREREGSLHYPSLSGVFFLDDNHRRFWCIVLSSNICSGMNPDRRFNKCDIPEENWELQVQ